MGDTRLSHYVPSIQSRSDSCLLYLNRKLRSLINRFVLRLLPHPKHKYCPKKKLKRLGSGVWNSWGGVHRLSPSERQHLYSVEKQEPEIGLSSLSPSEPNS